jgi:ParB family chromosome partitioning protein
MSNASPMAMVSVPELAAQPVAVLVSRGIAAIEQAGSFDEVKAIRDQAEALRVYSRSIGAALDAVNAAAELRIRAERRMGEALREAEVKAGRPKENPTPGASFQAPTLEQIGVTAKQSSRYQQIAAIPKATFETAIEAHKAADEPLSAAAVVRVAETLEALPEPVRQDVLANGPAEVIAVAHNHRAQGTGDNEWYTPAEHIEAARAVMGDIDLDPASSALANETVRAARFFDIEADGLAQEWGGRVWMNPPYAQPWIMRFCEKLTDEAAAGRVIEAIALTHNYTDTGWFHLLAGKANAVCFTRGRIGFLDPNGKRAAPTQGQAFTYIGPNVPEFVRQFSRFGLVMVRHAG